MSTRFSFYDPRRWWVDLVGVWQDTRLIVVTAQIAAIYAAILIPFKAGIPIIPGFVELRPANAIPIVASLLFGPAAAWGAGIGNIIGDCFGTLGPASVFGFLGNFLFGYLPYLMWGNLGWLSSGQPPMVKSWRQGLEYGLVCVVASGVCAGVIGWGVELLGLLPFIVLAPAIFFNNIVMGLLLGPPLLGFLYPRVQRWHLRYEDIRPSLVPPENLGNFHQTFPVEDDSINHAMEARTNVPLLACREFSFSYSTQTTTTLRNITFSIASGEFVMLLGRSGSGKSTLCYACNGLIPHMIPGTFSGGIQVCGEDTRASPVWKRAEHVGLVFQDFEAQLIGTTVGSELRHPLEYREVPLTFPEMNRRMAHALSSVGLDVDLDRDPMRMSGGQRQRLVMASVLVQEPQLVILDEPSSDLDPVSRTKMRQTLRRLREEGLSVLMTEQDHDDLPLADRVIVLDEGSTVWDGPPTMLLRDPGLMRQRGIRPLDLTECFEDLGCDPLPLTLEEAWACAEKLHLMIDPPAEVLDDSVRLGKPAFSLDAPTDPIIQIDGVSFQYEELPILQDITCAMYPGNFVALLGANGSGKSTLARLLNGLLAPTQGRILVEGLDTGITSMNELAKRVGLVFQNPDHQIFADTVWDEVAFGVKNLGCSQEEIAVRVRESLLAVGLPVERNGGLDPFSLRKGERQRVAVASILATRPTLLIFDEPTTGLDAPETDRMMTMICELHRQGHTIVMVTHSMRLVAEHAQRCLIMEGGKIVADGSPRDIFHDSALVRAASLEIPAISRFSQRWGHTLLTVNEVKASLKPKA
jgi:energy-coupling factor transporter ATP-binding protein EcfA2